MISVLFSTRFWKKLACLTAAAVLAAGGGAALFGCGKKPAPLPAVSAAPAILDGVALDYDKTVFDDFVGGVDPELWYIGRQAWGGKNGGVIPENVGYTDEGELVFTGNGEYYAAGEVSGVGAVKDGSLTGGALISKFLTGPGRYEIKMKVLPRLGACTAFWVYAYDNDGEEGPENHEIDIELPGGKTRGAHSFNALLNTNYITEGFNQSQDVDLASVMGTDGIYSAADGQYHTFGFDWYTNPEKVVYYMDGVVTAVSDVFVPSLTTRLWLGVWFPVNAGFVGNAEFERDYMYVDWVRYTPFADQPFTQFVPAVGASQVAALSEYPSAPGVYEAAEKISNGTFEYALQKSANGWTCDRTPRPDAPPLEEESRIGAGLGRDGTAGAVIKDYGVLNQTIDTIYRDFGYTLCFDAKTTGTAYLELSYRSEVSTLKNITVKIEGDDWKEYVSALTAPAGTTKLRMEFYTQAGSTAYIDNVSLVRA